MNEYRKEYKRSVINLGNSKAITFPGEWVEKSKLKEKTEVTLFPIDEKTVVVRTGENKDENKVTYNLIANKIPLRLIRQAIVSAFKLNVDQIHLKYNEGNQEKLYEILVDLRREIIGFDFKDNKETQEYYINFLLDASKTTYKEVLEDLISDFNAVIKRVINGEGNNLELLLDEVGRKYSLGTRILITGLSEYPFSRSSLPVINFLGDRVVLLLIRDFIYEACDLQEVAKDILKRYENVLLKIPNLLKALIENYQDLNLNIISTFQERLANLEKLTEEIQEATQKANTPIKNIIKYYLNNFKNLFDIGITRMIESEIGIS
ncbi:MAG: hypothetical protein P8Y70_07250 [Candidatus Lokiarchaeota archaeon]